MNSPQVQMARLALDQLSPVDRAELLADFAPATPAPIHSEGRALNLTAAARTGGVSRMTIHRAIKAGTLKACFPYAGARPRITEAELSRWLGAKK